MRLKEADAGELATVAQLAVQIWNAHYVPIIGQQQVDYMLNRMYSPQSLLEQRNAKNHIFYLVEDAGAVQGFISVHRETGDDWFLNKFYILPQHAAKGLGTRAFEALKEKLRPKKITLTVNRQNYKSINFYFKNQFRISRVADFDIGGGFVMNDFVMEWEDKVRSEK